ncbi:HlyD family secretion protein [Mucilaginibacter lappiensis]|uniref:Multidrug resistance efflux pump n=1 Tax=Mucilaginibacter lappiensis TaxID=354630 RepID=A0A841JJX3_9SPHI|nr:HlyD family efflux transporter periplasmic adaptor subunit [Mucilaginibacter lappiensis]MBB6131483.1 multidrug resistance efflux pump [Mucilaginibacter lappiensis]
MELTHEEEPVHSEQIQDIIGTPPRWLYRWGISLVLAIALICIIISTLIDYPLVVQAQIKLRPSFPPYKVFSQDSASVVKILVRNESTVRKGDSLAIVHNVNRKENVMIIAPIDGRLTYSGIIHENEQLMANQNMFYISGNNNDYYGEMIIPQKDTYRVKQGQTVLVTVKNSPDENYNKLKGIIKYITDGPSKGEPYIAEVTFSKSNDNLNGRPIRKEIEADAKIITANATLFHRLMQSLTKVGR